MAPTASSAGRDAGKRNVHWQEEQRERALGRITERDLILRKEILSSRESSPLKRTGQVLIPLPSLQPTVPADRPLQLLPYGTER